MLVAAGGQVLGQRLHTGVIVAIDNTLTIGRPDRRVLISLRETEAARHAVGDAGDPDVIEPFLRLEVAERQARSVRRDRQPLVLPRLLECAEAVAVAVEPPDARVED